jgi:phage terminase large subunit GpA-like protein
MDALSPQDPCQEVILKFSSQSGKTEVLNNFVGYIIDQDPGPILVINPNMKPMGEAWSKDRLGPMIRDCPVLTKKVSESKSRDSANTIMHKKFPGGHCTIGGANSPAGLAARPIRYLAFDEINRYEVTKEGDSILLATKRSQTFHNKKILKVSSPTFPDVGIDYEYNNSLQHEWKLKCLHCGEYQFPRFKHFIFEDRNEPVYVCEHCGVEHPISDEYRVKKTGQWFIVNEGNPIKKGYWFNQWASPFAKWQETIDEFLDAKLNPDKLQTVINTAFAEVWTHQGKTIDENDLFARREVYPEVPEQVEIITAGIDVQDDRLELEVVGWGAGDESWNIDYKILIGDPSQPEVWSMLTNSLRTVYANDDGVEFAIASACIDSGGHYTQTVYDYCSRRPIPRLYAIKGVAGEGKPIVTPRQLIGYPAKKKVLTVGVDAAKSLLFSYLEQHEIGPGYCHFPIARDSRYFNQLTAEKVVTKLHKGFPRRDWIKTRVRNEALDCRVYALCAMKFLPEVSRRVISRPVKAKITTNKRMSRENSNWFKR